MAQGISFVDLLSRFFFFRQLAAEVAGTEWSPSAPPPDWNTPPSLSSSDTSASASAPGPASGTRARGSNQPSGRNSPANFHSSGGNGGGGRSSSPFETDAQKQRNESFFERLGAANDNRPDHLPPSQGGKYAGFGSTPDLAPGPSSSSSSSSPSSHPSFALSSHNAPSLREFQASPMSALGKSWGLFSSAVVTAGSTINESVIQPGVQRANDGVRQLNEDERTKEISQKIVSDVRATGGWLSSIAGEGWNRANQLAKEKGGIDLNERLGSLGLGGAGGAGSGGMGGSGSGNGNGNGNGRGEYGHGGGARYDPLDSNAGYHDHDNAHGQDGWNDDHPALTASSQTAAATQKTEEPKKKEGEWDDEWKDF